MVLWWWLFFLLINSRRPYVVRLRERMSIRNSFAGVDGIGCVATETTEMPSVMRNWTK